MRLLVIGHSYLTAFAQRKYVAMKKLDSNLQICIVTPPEISHVFSRYELEIAPGMNSDEVVSIKTIFGKSHMTYTHNPFRLVALLKKFCPTHIHIEEDPHSLVAVETLVLARCFCRRATISFFIWDNLARRPHWLLNALKQASTKYSLARAALIVCGNNDARELLHGVKGYGGKSVVLPQLGLEPGEYIADSSSNIHEALAKVGQEPLIGFLGRLVPEKGIVLLLEALSRLQHLPWRLLIIGSGPLKQEIQDRWNARLGDRLISLDAVPHDAVSEYLKRLDIFVLPSYATETWKEQFGLTLAQAMMAGVACVASSSGAIPEVLGSTGVIFKERDVDSLAEALETLVRSKEKREELGHKAITFARQHYTNYAVSSAYLRAFESVKESKGCLAKSKKSETSADSPSAGCRQTKRNGA